MQRMKTLGQIGACGAGVFQIEITDATVEDYYLYQEMLEQSGFQKCVDNGIDGLAKNVWNVSYIRDELLVTIIHMKKRKRIYITAKNGAKFSKHLFYDEEYITTNCKDAVTKLHMSELHTYGDSFIIQLKNGHFILDDGGMPADTPYLLDYLEELTPEGEKPIIEGWFVSHGHGDHMGALILFDECPELAERIYVEGVYFSEPEINGETVQQGIKGVEKCRTVSGEIPNIYRPQTGQRYYFNDITIDVLHTQEQLPRAAYCNGFNDSSTWLLYTIEGQTFLHAGDAGRGSIGVVMDTYDEDMFEFDIIASFHHGQNIYDVYVDYFKYKTVLYTTFLKGSQTANWHTEDNERMQENAMECMSWGDGGKILTFPYKIGTAENIPMKEWIYHLDREKPTVY